MKSVENYNIPIKNLLKVFKKFKSNPKKIFVARDFFEVYPNLCRERYFETLRKLGLIERVPCTYSCGTHYQTRRGARGYRLKNNNILNIVLPEIDSLQKIEARYR